MKIRDLKIQVSKGSFFVYLPKIWINAIKLEKGDKITCFIDENDHQTLKLRKKHP